MVRIIEHRETKTGNKAKLSKKQKAFKKAAEARGEKYIIDKQYTPADCLGLSPIGGRKKRK